MVSVDEIRADTPENKSRPVAAPARAPRERNESGVDGNAERRKRSDA